MIWLIIYLLGGIGTLLYMFYGFENRHIKEDLVEHQLDKVFDSLKWRIVLLCIFGWPILWIGAIVVRDSWFKDKNIDNSNSLKK